MVCGPATLLPKHIESLGVKVELDIKKALEWCDVANILRIQLERQKMRYFPSLREYSQHYGVNKQLLDSLEKGNYHHAPWSYQPRRGDFFRRGRF